VRAAIKLGKERMVKNIEGYSVRVYSNLQVEVVDCLDRRRSVSSNQHHDEVYVVAICRQVTV
jgi:hypothetical protein